MKNLTKNYNWFTTMVILALFTGCAPVFSDLQSARTLGSGQVELTPYYTNTGKESDSKGINHIGTNFGIGLNENIDIRGKIDRSWMEGEENTGFTVVGLGPKFSLIPNRIALFIPAGRAFGNDAGNTWQMQPTVFLTQPIIPEKLELTLSPKYLLNLCQDCGGNFATNIGISGSKDFSKMAWRAEYGRIIGNGGGLGQFSIGISFVVNPKN